MSERNVEEEAHNVKEESIKLGVSSCSIYSYIQMRNPANDVMNRSGLRGNPTKTKFMSFTERRM